MNMVERNMFSSLEEKEVFTCCFNNAFAFDIGERLGEIELGFYVRKFILTITSIISETGFLGNIARILYEEDMAISFTDKRHHRLRTANLQTCNEVKRYII